VQREHRREQKEHADQQREVEVTENLGHVVPL
jgi:hypothetical protein